jgi:hypothetical protein
MGRGMKSLKVVLRVPRASVELLKAGLIGSILLLPQVGLVPLVPLVPIVPRHWNLHFERDYT